MTKAHKDGIIAGRLDEATLKQNFDDIHKPLTAPQAAVEAERCYYCYDAPCTTACPTSIDIPSFIKRIATGDLSSSAHKIFEENIFGGMCARVCPTETLCEQDCVRETSESQPVKIGLLQRHATDHAMANNEQFFMRAKDTGKTIAIVGAGPAGLACAHRLSMLGHKVQVFESRAKPGGLNEHGIAAYKTINNFAAKEVEYILKIGGIEIEYERNLGKDLKFEDLRKDYDAVFIASGLGGTRALGINEVKIDGVVDAIEFIENLRQAKSLTKVFVGRKVVVIGGGMTAVDCASQSIRLGSEVVSIVYRRGPDELSASSKEIDFAKHTGAHVRFWATPKRIIGKDKVEGVEFEYIQLEKGKLVGTGDTYTIEADMVLSAIGQTLVKDDCGGAELFEQKFGKLLVNDERKTSLEGVWAGGDCVYGGDDLTVSAVEDGKKAAHSIDISLKSLCND